MKRDFLVKSFGYGIMLAEAVPSQEAAPRGIEVLEMVNGSGLDVMEAVLDPEDLSRVYLLMPDGHTPSRHELEQMESADWERLRSAVAMVGSGRFLERLAMFAGRA